MADSLFTELKRRNVFKVSIGYLLIGWIVLQVADVIVPALGLPEWTITFLVVVGLLGLPFVVFFSWAFELTPEGIVPESEVDRSQSVTSQTGQKLNFVIISLLVVAVAYLGYNNYHLSSSEQSATAEKTNIASPKDSVAKINTIPLAVLPFVNMSNDPEQEFFVDGLTEELLNSLTRIEGIKVTARTSSFAYKNKNIDMRQIAEELGVDYLVEGSVRKSGQDLRVTLQLIEAKDGSHLLSETFNRKLTNVFALQEELSGQVAAALKLKLVLKDDRYNSALEKLDYIAVEQLVSARAKLAEYAELPVRDGITILNNLNTEYPNIPEIMGLMEFGKMIRSSIAESQESFSDRLTSIKSVLDLDSRNRDALITAAVIYDDFPDLQDEAYETYKTLIQYYPGQSENYTRLFKYLAYNARPCEEIQAFYETIPEGILDEEANKEADLFLRACIDINDPVVQEELNSHEKYTRFSNQLLNLDGVYTEYLRLYNETSNDRYTAILATIYLTAGVRDRALKLYSEVNDTRISYWAKIKINDAAIYNFEASKNPVEFLGESSGIFRSRSDTWGMSAFIKSALDTEKTAQIQTYLKGIAPFSSTAGNISETIGLVMLQYHAGYKTDSLDTALQAYKVLLDYAEKYPQSFKVYGLWPGLFYMALYSGQVDEAESILENNASDHEGLWIQSVERAKIILKPWLDEPAAQRFIAMIEADRLRLQKKFNLN